VVGLGLRFVYLKTNFGLNNTTEVLFLLKNNKAMTTITLEINHREDADLVIQLAKRLHVEKIEVSDDELFDDLIDPSVLSDAELEERLEKAANTPSVSYEAFRATVSQWK
jgi:hypothetical protein